MIISMTGYGSARKSFRDKTIEVEVHSVNSKSLSIKVHLPRFLQAFDHKLKKLITSSNIRGSLTIHVKYEERNRSLDPHEKAFSDYYRFLKALQKKFKLDGNISLDQLLKLYDRDSIRFQKKLQEDWKQVEQITVKALKQWKQSRLEEGRQLGRFFKREIDTIDAYVKKIKLNDAKRIQRKKQTVLKRLQSLGSSKKVDSSLFTDSAIELNKIDITEEIDRLQSHIITVKKALKSSKSEGKRTNFLIQEMQREANTLGVKCGDVEFIDWAITIKESIEKLKEQVGNIE